MGSSRARAGPVLRETPLHAHFGAELHLAAPLDPRAAGVVDAVADALLRHGMVLVRGQTALTAQEQFELVLGLPDIDADDAQGSPFSRDDPSCLPGLPGVRALGHQQCGDGGGPRAPQPEQNRLGREFHTDGCGFTALHAVAAPPATARRSTLFACGYRAWELLEPELQRTAVGLDGRIGPRCSLPFSCRGLP